MNEEILEKTIKDNKGSTIILDFYSETCGPCKLVSNILDEIDKEYLDKVKITKLNVYDYPELAEKYEVSGLPTVIILKGDEKITLVGYKPKAEYTKYL